MPQVSSMEYDKSRKHLLKWLRKQLIGPASAHDVLQGILPLDRYPTGILFPPIVHEESGIDPATLSDSGEDEYIGGIKEKKDEKNVEPATKYRRYIPPSSVGFSFFAQGEVIKFQVVCSASRYEREGVRDEDGRFREMEYRRIVLGGEEEALTFEADMPSRRKFRQRKDVFKNRGGVDLFWRPFHTGWIITLSLFNKQELDWNGEIKQYLQERNEKSLFEVDIRCIFETGQVGHYPCVDKNLLSSEEREIEFRYRDRHIYAVGHGAAVDWHVKDGHVKELHSEFIPAVEVPQVTADVADSDNPVLSFQFLAGNEDREEKWENLDRFVEDYSKWIADQKIDGFAADELDTAADIIKHMKSARDRMQQGISRLRKDELVAKAFRLANQAMLDQMRQDHHIKDGPPEDEKYTWRPFQLAFLLMSLESVVNEYDDFRDIVDLIWFPTGGGKTEAYLGLIAFLIIWRRLKFPSSCGGTTVLMRYTLRLLTVQQFKRAARIICALELIRRLNPEMGKEQISIGLWVGAATSPNTLANALEAVQKAGGTGNPTQKLVLDSCPWCGTQFQAPVSYIADHDIFHFRCLNDQCDFGKNGHGALPCNVVDQELYRNPPTLLLATIDKFARLAWEERTSSFFGISPARPPELIIQDELHLISSALGSIAGLYETAIDTVLQCRDIHPKYIASTATIRMAEQQVKRLYGRELAIFPPPGLSCDDSYFARTIPLSEKPGRLYVGYQAPMLNRQRCMAPLAAALYIGPEAVFREGEQDRELLLDAWWTMIIYHGSLKGVGNSHNAFDTHVRKLADRLKKELKQSRVDNQGIVISRSTAHPVQLTSLSSAEENAETFSRLERTRVEKDCIDVVLATNMISVGLDVDRLALMVINGQPLTTAEYIQASSRVGRSDIPGLVFINYYRDQARSLSHYENFRPYHESFYRFVEPTSVTPYTYQARTRALHAALVIALRHSCKKLLGNKTADRFSVHDDCIQKVIETFKQRCKDAEDDYQIEKTACAIDRLTASWQRKAEECRNNKRGLYYQVPDNENGIDRLLYNYGDKIKGEWQALQSMRNVEDNALLKIL